MPLTMNQLSMPSASATTATTIKLRVIDKQNSIEWYYRLKVDAKLAKLKKSYAESVGVNVWSLKFKYADRQLTDEDTPSGLDMEYGDMIEVYGAPFMSGQHCTPAADHRYH